MSLCVCCSYPSAHTCTHTHLHADTLHSHVTHALTLLWSRLRHERQEDYGDSRTQSHLVGNIHHQVVTLVSVAVLQQQNEGAQVKFKLGSFREKYQMHCTFTVLF